jgi:Domain of unknown function (DUF4258)
MSAVLDSIKALVVTDNVRVSLHAFRRLTKHKIAADDLLNSVDHATVIEDYPGYFAGPAVLVLSFGADGRPLHAVWGLENGTTEPAVLITTYRPDPARWEADHRTRKP